VGLPDKRKGLPAGEQPFFFIQAVMITGKSTSSHVTAGTVPLIVLSYFADKAKRSAAIQYFLFLL